MVSCVSEGLRRLYRKGNPKFVWDDTSDSPSPFLLDLKGLDVCKRRKDFGLIGGRRVEYHFYLQQIFGVFSSTNRKRLNISVKPD